MVALGPRMLVRLNFQKTLQTVQEPLTSGRLSLKVGPRLGGWVNQNRMGSASGDSRDPPPALVLCGPSGAGKSTLMKLLTSEFRLVISEHIPSLITGDIDDVQGTVWLFCIAHNAKPQTRRRAGQGISLHFKVAVNMML